MAIKNKTRFLLLMLYIFIPLYSLENEKIAFWGPVNIACGIAMYTEHIKTALKKFPYIIEHYEHDKSISLIYTLLSNQKIKILNIQFMPSLFPEEEKLIAFIKLLRDSGIKVIVTIHSEPTWAQKLVDAANVTIYHKLPLRLTDSSKVTILPMGVPNFIPPNDRMGLRAKYSFSAEDKLLVSTGFMLPSKEIDKILELLAPKILKDPKIKVQLIHSFNEHAKLVSQREYNKVVETIAKFGIQKQIILITDFISQEELQERLYISDLGYQWFFANTDATSAAAKEYISTRTPLIIPNCNHYHDMNHDGVVVTEKNMEIFAETIIHFLNNPQWLRLSRLQLDDHYKKLNYDYLISDYHALLQSL